MAEDPEPTKARRRAPEPVPPDLFAVKIEVTPESLTELLSKFHLDVGDHPHVEPTAGDAGTLYAFAPEAQIRELEAAGFVVEVVENASEIGRQRMAEVGKGDRFEGGRIPPRGHGHKPGRDDRPDGTAKRGEPAR